MSRNDILVVSNILNKLYHYYLHFDNFHVAFLHSERIIKY